MRTQSAIGGRSVVIVSRCAWTLYNFRVSLIEEATAAGAKVCALADGRDDYARRLLEKQINFQHIAIARRAVSPFRDAILLLQLIQTFRRLRPEVVHSFTIKPSIFATMAARLAGVRVRVVTITGLGYAFTSAPVWLRFVVSALYKLALSSAHVVQFQNKDDRALFVDRGLVPSAKARLVAGSGVNLQRFEEAPLLSNGQAVRFLMIARLIREKGVLEFVEAARIVTQRYPHATFSLLGGEDTRNPSGFSAEQLAEIKHSSVIRWLGETDDVRPHIRTSDVVVLPSYREGLPRSLLEAGAMGRPAIATDVPGCREVVVDGVTGYLVPPRDSASLVAAMRMFMDAPERVAIMGKAARQNAIEKFDERIVIAETLRIYSDLISEKR